MNSQNQQKSNDVIGQLTEIMAHMNTNATQQQQPPQMNQQFASAMLGMGMPGMAMMGQ
jgi:hypothetical protein